MNWESEDYKNSLIELKPRLSLQTRCPWCNCMDLLEDWIWQGVHFIGIYRCFCCERKFHLTLPTGHAKEFPVAMDENFQPISYPEAAKDWLAKPLIASLQQPKPGLYQFEHQVRRKKDRIIIINCLDTCYGHVLYKLFYSQQYFEQEEYGLLYLVPENVTWMMPERADEVLVVKGRLEEMKAFDSGMDGWMHEMVEQKLQVYLSESLADIDEKLFKPQYFIPAISTASFRKSGIQADVLFIIREDRPWVSNRFDYLLFLLSKKLPILDFLKNYLIYRQKLLLHQVVIKIRLINPNLSCSALGVLPSESRYTFLSQPSFNPYPVKEQEEKWLKKCHDARVVIGVHGSHMILPGIVAKTIINIIPPFKQAFTGQDILKEDKSDIIFLSGLISPNRLLQQVKLFLD